jgi:hypothetical protein
MWHDYYKDNERASVNGWRAWRERRGSGGKGSSYERMVKGF